MFKMKMKNRLHNKELGPCIITMSNLKKYFLISSSSYLSLIYCDSVNISLKSNSSNLYNVSLEIFPFNEINIWI